MYDDWDTEPEKRTYWDALLEMRDQWVAGACGTEVPLMGEGEWWLYVYNPARDMHGWLHMASDTVYDSDGGAPGFRII